MGALAALKAGGGGAQWAQAPKSWWDSACSWGDVVQEMGRLRKGRPGLLRCEVAAPGQASESNHSSSRLPLWCPYTSP